MQTIFGTMRLENNDGSERMNLSSRSLTLAGPGGRIRGMFNLNDPRWGRGEDKNADGQRPEGKGPSQGPPDLDELWRDFNRKLSGLFGGKRGGGGFGGGGNGNFQPDMKSAGVGAGLIAIVVIVIWMATGIFIVQVHGVTDAPLPAVASLGVRPTVEDAGRVLLEVHIFDFARNLYGERVKVE